LEQLKKKKEEAEERRKQKEEFEDMYNKKMREKEMQLMMKQSPPSKVEVKSSMSSQKDDSIDKSKGFIKFTFGMDSSPEVLPHKMEDDIKKESAHSEKSEEDKNEPIR